MNIGRPRNIKKVVGSPCPPWNDRRHRRCRAGPSTLREPLPPPRVSCSSSERVVSEAPSPWQGRWGQLGKSHRRQDGDRVVLHSAVAPLLPLLLLVVLQLGDVLGKHLVDRPDCLLQLHDGLVRLPCVATSAPNGLIVAFIYTIFTKVHRLPLFTIVLPQLVVEKRRSSADRPGRQLAREPPCHLVEEVHRPLAGRSSTKVGLNHPALSQLGRPRAVRGHLRDLPAIGARFPLPLAAHPHVILAEQKWFVGLHMCCDPPARARPEAGLSSSAD